jgi:dihydrofolate reductase
MPSPLVRLYVATSLDGFIADPDGGVGWLSAYGDPEAYGFGAFVAGVGAIVMGRASYDQLPEFGPWPYGDRECVVFTHRPPAHPHTPATFVSGDPAPVVEGLRRRHTRDVWLFGGGGVVEAFRRAGLIDEYHLFVVPVLLGAGRPLFPGAPPREGLRLEEARPYPDGLVELRYARA